MTIKYNNKIIVGAGALLALAITATAPAQAEVCGAEGHMGACWGYHTYPSNNSVSPSVPSGPRGTWRYGTPKTNPSLFTTHPRPIFTPTAPGRAPWFAPRPNPRINWAMGGWKRR